jgi:zinc/manganese transport system substrate-binding protein
LNDIQRKDHAMKSPNDSRRAPWARALMLLWLVPFFAVGALADGEERKLRVLATTTDLRELCREVGGDDVVVTCLMKGPEDPHFLDARPSFVKAAAEADALVVIGKELEVGYEPLLLSESRNGNIQKGRPGYVDCSAEIEKLDVPTGNVDRSLGDVHPFGNPHYLLDPVRAKTAAKTVADAFATLDPPRADAYRRRRDDFARRIDVAMWGEALLAEQKAERLERRLAEGKLLDFLKQRGLDGKLGGLAAELAPFAGKKVVSYHANASYLLDRFHLEQVGTLEPKPGIPPSPRHLAQLEERMKAEGAKLVLHVVFQPAKTAESVASDVGGAAVRIAHMPDAVQGTASYLETLKFNVHALADAFRRTSAK